MRVKELEEEIARLRRERDLLARLLHESTNHATPVPEQRHGDETA